MSENFSVRTSVPALTEKISCLTALHGSLRLFYEKMEDLTPDEVSASVACQAQYRSQIDEIDQRYAQNFAPSAAFDQQAQLLLSQYRALLAEVAALNDEARVKALELSAKLRNKIKDVRSKKNAVSSFRIFGQNQTGNLYDYKEGK